MTDENQTENETTAPATHALAHIEDDFKEWFEDADRDAKEVLTWIAEKLHIVKVAAPIAIISGSDAAITPEPETTPAAGTAEPTTAAPETASTAAEGGEAATTAGEAI